MCASKHMILIPDQKQTYSLSSNLSLSAMLNKLTEKFYMGLKLVCRLDTLTVGMLFLLAVLTSQSKRVRSNNNHIVLHVTTWGFPSKVSLRTRSYCLWFTKFLYRLTMKNWGFFNIFRSIAGMRSV